MRFVLIFLFLPTILYADQGLNISCVNMKNLLDENYKIHRFYFDVTTFHYFDDEKNDFVKVPNKDLIIKEDFFAARFPEYELGFQVNVFEDDKNPVMSMSKYDYNIKKFLDHFLCDVKVAYKN